MLPQFKSSPAATAYHYMINASTIVQINISNPGIKIPTFETIENKLRTHFELREILQNKIIARFDNIKSNYLLELGGGLGCHAGPGALVVGLQKLDKEI